MWCGMKSFVMGVRPLGPLDGEVGGWRGCCWSAGRWWGNEEEEEEEEGLEEVFVRVGWKQRRASA